MPDIQDLRLSIDIGWKGIGMVLAASSISPVAVAVVVGGVVAGGLIGIGAYMAWGRSEKAHNQ